MLLFPNGIKITKNEYKCIQYIEADPEVWLQSTLHAKAGRRRDALIRVWRPRLFADSAVTEIPADPDALARLIMDRADYKTRAQADTECGELPALYQTTMFEATVRSTQESVTFCPNGLTITDQECDCILAYIPNIDDWIYGAILGHINRGKKKMILKYAQVLFEDPTVSTSPADYDGMIELITSRSDYLTMPQQIEENIKRRESSNR